jgi:hypothetical protein
MTTQSTPSIDRRAAVPPPSAAAELRGWPKLWLYLILAAISIFNAGWILNQAGVSFSHPFAPTDAEHHDVHRRQAAAMLDGHFWLSRSIFDTHFDNVYVNGKVQQVWGLGVPMYLIPFELFGRAIGISPFPDRITLGILLAAFFFYCGTLLMLLPDRGFSIVQAAGIVAVIAFSPPLLNLLLNGPQYVYEDASVVALLTSLAIFVAVVRFIARRQMSDYWICCLLGGMSGLVRPTHAIYGLLGPAICCVLLLRDHRVRAAIIPLLLMVAGMAFLAVSNRIRFGAFTEFGHKETLTSADGEMTSRFVNPISVEPPLVAARELCGALFFAFGDIRHMGWFDPHLFPGQADCFRWRDFYVTSYDPTLLALVLGGVALGVWRIPRSGRQCAVGNRPPLRVTACFLNCLLVWGSISSIVIFAFMVYYPGLCVRYFYDLWPGFLGLIVFLWVTTSGRHQKAAAALLTSWLVFQCYRMDCRMTPLPALSFAEVQQPHFDSQNVLRLRTAGFYDSSHLPPHRLCQGIDFENGISAFEARLPLDAPRFLELVVGRRQPSSSTDDRQDVYRARISDCELPLLSVVEQNNGNWSRVTFGVPTRITNERSDELLFLSFVKWGDVRDQRSTRNVVSVRWR